MFKSWQVFVFSLVPLALVFAGVIIGSMNGLDSELETFPTAAPQAENGGGTPAATAVPGAAELQLAAKDSKFEQTSLSASAGQPVSVVFDNQDAGVPHNFALYADSGYTQSIFKGDIVTGVITTTYNFDAPSTPGGYFFRCDVHPDAMKGQFSTTVSDAGNGTETPAPMSIETSPTTVSDAGNGTETPAPTSPDASPTTVPDAENGTATAAPTTAPSATELQLAAKDIKFEQTSLSVSAGQPVSVVFDNQDASVPHNFALYADSGYTQSIFRGDIVTGVITTTYNFDAPSTPGDYFFRCDVHPDAMQGQFTAN